MEQSVGGGSREEGIRLLKSGHIDEAIGVLGELCRKNPDDAQIHMYLGIAYGQKNDKLHAIHHLETSCNLEENPRALYNLGMIYEAAHRIDEAVRQYRMAVELDPGYTLAQEALNKLHLKYEAAHVTDAPAAAAEDATTAMPDAGPVPTTQQATGPPPSASAGFPPFTPPGPPDGHQTQLDQDRAVRDAHKNLMKNGTIYGAICGAILFVLLSLLGGLLIASYSAKAGIVYLTVQAIIGGLCGALIGLWIGYTAGDERAGAQAGAVLGFIYGLINGLTSDLGIGFALVAALVYALFGAIGGYIIGRLVESSVGQV